jgi:hypothetical protein
MFERVCVPYVSKLIYLALYNNTFRSVANLGIGRNGKRTSLNMLKINKHRYIFYINSGRELTTSRESFYNKQSLLCKDLDKKTYF